MSYRLDLSGKIYQREIWPQIKTVVNGKKVFAPIVVDLDPTTTCDLACPECISFSVLNQGRFTTDRLLSLGQELIDVGVRGVILIGGGEPLLHPGLKSLVELLANADIQLALVTNGTMLHRYFDQVPLFKWIRVSVDAGSAQTYHEYRPSRGGKCVFDKVIKNITCAARLRTAIIGFSFLVMTRQDVLSSAINSNVDEMFAAAALAKNCGCGYFEAKAMLESDHFISQQGQTIMSRLCYQLAEINQLRSQSFEIIISSSLESLLRGLPATQPKEYKRCSVSKLRTTVTPLGVYICAYHRGNTLARLGDPINESFSEIWGRVDSLPIDPSEHCKFHCSRHSTNLELERLRGGQSVNLHDGDDIFI